LTLLWTNIKFNRYPATGWHNWYENVHMKNWQFSLRKGMN